MYDIAVCILHIKHKDLKQFYRPYAISTNTQLLLSQFFLPDSHVHGETGNKLLYVATLSSTRKTDNFILMVILSSPWPFGPFCQKFCQDVEIPTRNRQTRTSFCSTTQCISRMHLGTGIRQRPRAGKDLYKPALPLHHHNGPTGAKRNSI